MRVLVFPADDQAVGWYRVRWPALVLQKSGADVGVREVLEARDCADEEGRAAVTVRNVDADVVVFQRPLVHIWLAAMRDLQARGVRVVVEVDDDFVHIPAAHPIRRMDPRGEHRRVLQQCCAEADMVTVSTPALARIYGAHGRVRVVRNCVPAYYLTLARDGLQRKGRPVLGWGGPSWVHIDDLEECRLAVRQALEETRARFRALGDPEILDRFGVQGSSVEWKRLANMDYARELADLDVGMAPLRLNAFNESKSALKGYEMAALGVPFVASPTSEYQRLHAAGVGRLASRPREWRRELVRLLTDADWREEVRARGLEVAKTLTFEQEGWQWWAAWKAALDRVAVAV